MAGLSTSGKNIMLDALRGVSTGSATHASLHTADPGGSGTSEVSGGSPAYARKSITWNAAASANLDSSNAPVFDVPASTTVTHVGFWSAVTAGTFYGSIAMASSETYSAQGTFTLVDADWNM